MIRRVSDPYMRAISSPDDYFSLALLTVWFLFALLAVPNDITGGEGIVLTYFLLTAFFSLAVSLGRRHDPGMTGRESFEPWSR